MRTLDYISKKSRILSIVGASSGNFIEWYDFNIYAYCAIYFAPIFFPKDSATIQLLNTAAIFAAGFLMRPIGAWWFGKFADQHGRRQTLMMYVLLMSVGSLIIALCPGFDSIAYWAPAILLLARLIQGFSVGGEYGTTATYMSEIAGDKHRGYFSSFQYLTMIAGLLFATTTIAILERNLSTHQIQSWGWRVPFLIGVAMSIAAFFIRRSLYETSTDASRNAPGSGSLQKILHVYRRAFLSVIIYSAAGSLSFYTFAVYMQKFLINSAGFSASLANHIMMIGLSFFMAIQPFIGILSDHIGKRSCYLIFSGFGALLTVPLLTQIHQVTNADICTLLVISGLGIISFYTAVSGIIKAELFPAEVRALGVGLAYSIGNALFGGTAEYFALKLKSLDLESLFYWYVSFVMAIAFLVMLRNYKLPSTFTR